MTLRQDRELSEVVKRAIKSGHVPVLRNWRENPELLDEFTLGEKVCFFIETYLHVPEGDLVGQPVRLLEFQEVFILSVFDGPVRARRAILSVGRKAGKTTITACLMLAFMFMRDLIRINSRVNSAALSRDQSSLVYTYMSKCLQQSPALEGKYRLVHSGRQITSLTTGIEYTALAAEAGRAMGLSPAVLIGDEWGSILAATNEFVDAVLTAQGAHSNPLAIIISTQAPSDTAMLSVMIDDAERSPSAEVVCHLYTADKQLELNDPVAWAQACPAAGAFRSVEDIRMQAEQAMRLPDRAASFENLILNRRVALSNLWLAPSVWKKNSTAPDLDVLVTNGASLGLDLSIRSDLTAAVASAMDGDGFIHAIPFCFIPEQGLAERELRDKIPYQSWVKQGLITAVPGAAMDYKWLAEWLKIRFEELGITIMNIEFDRWRIMEFKRAADEVGFGQEAVWNEVGQGYQSMSPRIEAIETFLLQSKIRHGGHPLLNMAAAGAIITKDPAGNRKVDKSKAATKIDPIVAMVMSCYPHAVAGTTDLSAWIV